MAYGTKYQFTWESQNGATCSILIQKDGYSGSAAVRHLGRAPVLKRKNSGRVYGTSLEIYAECKVDQEFSELYTPNAREYKVLLQRGNTTIWTGFVSPELYAEPDIAPPYDVQIVATDGLGELKQYTFEAQGDKTLGQLFSYLIGFSGGIGNINRISYLQGRTSAGDTVSEYNLWNTALINIDYKAGESCYDVLQYLLTTLCASITFRNNAWLIWRDNEISPSNSPPVSIGSMGNSDVWPVGQLSTKVEPAKKRITVEAPFHQWTPLVNPDMDRDAGWTKSYATFNTAAKAYKLGLTGSISQTISSIDMSVGLQVVTHLGHASAAVGRTGRYGQLQFQPSGSSYKFSLCDKNDGEGIKWYRNDELYPMHPEYGWNYDLHLTIGDVGSAPETSIDIPQFDVSGYSQTGSLEVLIWGILDTLVYDFYLYRPISKGFRDVLNIDNGARGDGDMVDIAQGRVTAGMVSTYYGYLRGVLTYGGNDFVTSFIDSHFSSYSDFLALTARNYARLVALPLLRVTGKVNTPASFSVPMLLGKDGVYYLLKTYSWDMKNDELEIDALSLPSGNLTIESEQVVDTTGESASSGGTSGGGGSSGGTVVTWGTEGSDHFSPLTVAGDQRSVALSGHTHNMDNITEGSTYKKVTQAEKNTWSGKQDALTFDDTPTAGSNNPVKSGGIKAALDGKQATLTFDDTPTENSNNPVKSGGIWTSIRILLQAIGQKASAAWGSIVNNKASLTVNDTSRTVLLDGWVPGTAGDHGTPVFAAPRTENETYKYKRGSSGEPADVTTSVTKGEPRVINHIGTHPELSSPIVVPGLMNDLAYFITRGGTCALYVNNTERTDALYNYDKAALFNLAPGSMQFQGDNTVSDVTYHRYLTSPNDVVKLILDPTGIADARVSLGTFSQQERYSTRYSWGSILSVDFGNDHWGPQQVKVTVKYGYYTISGSRITIVEDTDHRERFQFDGQTVGGVKQNLDFVTMTLNSQTSYGIVGIELEMTGFNQEGDTYCKPRISEVILINLNSTGAAEAFMSRYRDDAIYRSITPATSEAFDLGASGARWRQVHAKRVYLSSSAYLEVDVSGKAHLYGATGLVVENGDIASAGAPQS